jgi:hypothetical protein
LPPLRRVIDRAPDVNHFLENEVSTLLDDVTIKETAAGLTGAQKADWAGHLDQTHRRATEERLARPSSRDNANRTTPT